MVINIDAVVITDTFSTEQSRERAVAHFGRDRVMIPDLLRASPTARKNAAAMRERSGSCRRRFFRRRSAGAVNSTVGVSRLICHGGVPVEVSRDVITSLQCRHDEGGFVRRQREAFRAGQKIRVRDGAFSDFPGFFESMNDGDRVAVLLELLGRKVRVMLSADVIEAA